MWQCFIYAEVSNIGFYQADDAFELKTDEALLAVILKFFKSTQLTRIQVVQYAYLSSDIMKHIVQPKLDKIGNLFSKRYNAELHFDDNINPLQ